jgi:hypothetical protein
VFPLGSVGTSRSQVFSARMVNVNSTVLALNPVTCDMGTRVAGASDWYLDPAEAPALPPLTRQVNTRQGDCGCKRSFRSSRRRRRLGFGLARALTEDGVENFGGVPAGAIIDPDGAPL